MATLEALGELGALLGRVTFPLALHGSDEATLVRDELAGQIADYLLPRLARLDAPVLVVVGGSTGSGKSTIVNSLVGAEVSRAGVLRPSTRSPVLVCHPDDLEWFSDGGGSVLPGLPRSTGSSPVPGSLHLVASERLPPGLALLDSPDIDSVEIANHDLAAQLLGAADVWLFVTTAARYADAVPWEYLRRARERAVALSVAVNRIPAGAATEIIDHFRAMLGEHGLGDGRVFPILESEVLAEGRLEPDAIGALDEWLNGLVADGERRDEIVRASIDGAVASIPSRVDAIAEALGDQRDAAERLRAVSRAEYLQALDGLDLDDTALLRGEVLDCWREHVGSGAFMDRLQAGVARVRGRIGSIFTGRPAVVEAAPQQLGDNLATLVRNSADEAAHDTVTAWERLPGGDEALAGADRGIDRADPLLDERLAHEFDRWQEAVFQMVRAQAGDKLAVARALAWGINGVGIATMIAVFAQTGGITGAEAGVAAGTAAVSQTVLTAVFGDQAVRELVRAARADLELRLAGVFEVERVRFDRLLAALPDPELGDRLRSTAGRLG